MSGVLGDVEATRFKNLRWSARIDALKSTLIIGVGTLLVIATIVFVIPALSGIEKRAMEYLVVGALSGLVGYGELVSRYQDSPAKLFGASPTPLYILVNVVAAVAALKIVQTMGLFNDKAAPWLYEILLAGFGAIAFFRTSLFTVRIGGSDIGIGPSALLQSLLSATDRMLDRDQAEGRAEDVAGIMREVDYTKARTALPALCLILVQNLTQADQEAIGKQILSLDSTAMDADAKSIVLGVYLIRVVGADVLERSVAALRPYIAKDSPAVAPAV